MIDRATYPNLARLDDVHAEKLVVADFLEWLDGERIGLASVIRGDGHDRWAPITEGHESLAARYLGLDLNAIERERRAMLAAHIATTQKEAV